MARSKNRGTASDGHFRVLHGNPGAVDDTRNGFESTGSQRAAAENTFMAGLLTVTTPSQPEMKNNGKTHSSMLIMITSPGT